MTVICEQCGNEFDDGDLDGDSLCPDCTNRIDSSYEESLDDDYELET